MIAAAGGTAGLIQKLVDENVTRKLDQNDYRKKYDGYANQCAALESRLDSLEKERCWKCLTNRDL